MNKVKFAVFTDLHYDHIPDGDRRLQEFINKVKKKDIDFIIELGDMCYPIEENQVVLKLLGKAGVPCYHTIGNHDSDTFSRDKVMYFLGMKNNYYSFVKGDIKFIVLDTCYIKRDNEYIQYYKRNYDQTSDIYPYIPPTELSWLEKELDDSYKYYILFSHHSIANEFAKRGVANREEVRRVIEKASGS